MLKDLHRDQRWICYIHHYKQRIVMENKEQQRSSVFAQKSSLYQRWICYDHH